MSDTHDEARWKIEPAFDQRRRVAAAPFKEPDTPKLVVVPEQPTIKPTHTAQNIEAAIDASRGGHGTSSEYQTTPALKNGLIGERLAADALSQQGHDILDCKPDIAGTNQAGIDIVSMKDGTVYFVDNKAYGTGKNVGAVSALDKNFDKNVADVREKFEKFANDPNRSEGERKLYGAAVEAIDNKNYVKAVTTAAVAPDGKHSSGITGGLSDKGLTHISVDPSRNTGLPPPRPSSAQSTAPKLVVDPGTELVPTNQPGTQLTVTSQPGTNLMVTGQPGTQLVPRSEAGAGSAATPHDLGAVEPAFDARRHAAAAGATGPAAGAKTTPGLASDSGVTSTTPANPATTPGLGGAAQGVGPGPASGGPSQGSASAPAPGSGAAPGAGPAPVPPAGVSAAFVLGPKLG